MTTVTLRPQYSTKLSRTLKKNVILRNVSAHLLHFTFHIGGSQGTQLILIPIEHVFFMIKDVPCQIINHCLTSLF